MATIQGNTVLISSTCFYQSGAMVVFSFIKLMFCSFQDITLKQNKPLVQLPIAGSSDETYSTSSSLKGNETVNLLTSINDSTSVKGALCGIFIFPVEDALCSLFSSSFETTFQPE